MNSSALGKYRIAFLLMLIMVFVFCFSLMNTRFDRLSRYPYRDDEEMLKKMDETMTDQEIEYLIEYSISPSYFKKYFLVKRFNIYHVDFYNTAHNRATYLSNDDVVEFVEEMIENNVIISEVLENLRFYSAEELRYFYLSKDAYLDDVMLFTDFDNPLKSIPKGQSIGNHKPSDLENAVIEDREITLRKEAIFSLNDLIKKEDIHLLIDTSYLSYEQQVKDYLAKKTNILPGCNDFQLGYSFLLSKENDMATLERFSVLVLEYGFVKEKDGDIYLWRYVGRENAKKLFDNKSLEAWLKENKK